MDEITSRVFQQQSCYRLIPSRYPTIDVFDDVATAEELAAVWAVEALTNARLREEAGDLNRIPSEDWLVGVAHSSYVMAAFTHVNPEGGRFTTGDFGGYYCAPHLDTAIKETVYHQERILGYTAEPAQRIQMRSLFARFDADLWDITGEPFARTSLYHPTDYSPGQAMAVNAHQQHADGLVYCSVRHSGYECYVLYRPRLVTEISQSKHFEYHWNGRAIINVFETNVA